MKTIGDGAFSGCSSLTSITIPNSVTSIESSAFSGCSSVTSITIGSGVTTIGSSAFSGCGSLTSVAIPDSVTSIGDDAFSGCVNLTNITIGDGITSIGDHAFSGYGKLTSVTIGNGVKSIGKYAFYDCGNLASVKIGSGVKTIGEQAFFGCGSLKSITIPSNVESIGPYAFSYCENLKSLTLSDNLSSIGVYAFKKCTSLESVVLPDSLKSISEGAFSDCSGLKSVTIGNGATTIGEQAFFYCDGLKSVTMGNSVTTIGNNAFSWCRSLTSITLSKSITSIGAYAFSGASLSVVNYDGTVGQWEKVSIAEGNEEWQYYIVHCTDGDAIPHGTCGKNLTWKYDTSHTLTISGTGNMDDYSWDNDGPSEVGAPWGGLRDSIEKLVIENGVTSIGTDAFKHCSKLKNVVVPDSVSSIGDRAFMDCVNLTVITLPGKMTNIGSEAFRECFELKEIVIPSGVTTIKEKTFFSCFNLSSVKIPESVTTVEASAFGNNDALAHVYYSGTMAQWRLISIKDGNDDLKEAVIHCSDGISGVDEGCDVLGHNYGAWNETMSPTCTAKGTQARKCTRCGEIETRIVAARGHDYKNGRCDRCGAADTSAPATPALQSTTSAGKPKISWNAVDGATKYWIYRSTDGKTFKYYDSTTKTSYTNKSTSIGTTYYYKVKAVKTVDGTNYTSDLSGAKSILCKPAAPTVSIYRTNGKPKLTWKAVTGASKYYIYRSTDGKTFKYYEKTTKTSFTDSKSASGKKYYYKVKAVTVVNGKAIVSGYSNVKSIFTSLAKPTVKITTASGKPKLTWGKVTGADKYYVYRSTDGKTFKHFATTTKLSYTNTSAKKGTKYYYKVKAVYTANTNANSAYSAVVSIKATK